MPDSIQPIIGPYEARPAVCRDYDRRAPEVAKQIGNLIHEHLPQVFVEHVGSTSVPGCAGKGIVDLMIPVVKGWSTESAVDLASQGVQVHGGMGYIEETGAAQHLRDARIAPIYEGTTGIQAADLIGRKIARDGGDAARAVLARISAAKR